jgi:hypothetical protein
MVKMGIKFNVVNMENRMGKEDEETILKIILS